VDTIERLFCRVAHEVTIQLPLGRKGFTAHLATYELCTSRIISCRTYLQQKKDRMFNNNFAKIFRHFKTKITYTLSTNFQKTDLPKMKFISTALWDFVIWVLGSRIIVVVNLVDAFQMALLAIFTGESLATVVTTERFYFRVAHEVTIQLPLGRKGFAAQMASHAAAAVCTGGIISGSTYLQQKKDRMFNNFAKILFDNKNRHTLIKKFQTGFFKKKYILN
jgi:hypothetical protein